MKKVILIGVICFVSVHLSCQLSQLSDEFNRICSLYDWNDVNTIEQWNASHLEVIDIDQTNDDHLTLMPWTTSWYQNYRSNLLLKEVTGNFVFTSNVTVSTRSGTGFPSSTFSLTGIMARIPTEITPSSWTIGLEDYIFLSIGRAVSTTSWQFERKSTTNSNSQLVYEDIDDNEADIRMVKVNNAFIVMLKQASDTTFQILHRYNRPDMNDTTLQVGLVAYTDYQKVATYSHDTSFYNSHVITDTLNPDPGIPMRTPDPDVIGQFDYARFEDINIPPQYAGLDFSDSNEVSDSVLLSLFGYDSTPSSEMGWKIWRGSNSDWDNPLNWSGNSLPTSQDSILIPNCGCNEIVYPILSDGSHSYSSLKIETGGQLTIQSNDSLTIDLSGSFSLFKNEGIILNEGTIVVEGSQGKPIQNSGTIQCLSAGQMIVEE